MLRRVHHPVVRLQSVPELLRRPAQREHVGPSSEVAQLLGQISFVSLFEDLLVQSSHLYWWRSPPKRDTALFDSPVLDRRLLLLHIGFALCGASHRDAIRLAR